jgi:hypothetical protein
MESNTVAAVGIGSKVLFVLFIIFMMCAIVLAPWGLYNYINKTDITLPTVPTNAGSTTTDTGSTTIIDTGSSTIISTGSTTIINIPPPPPPPPPAQPEPLSILVVTQIVNAAAQGVIFANSKKIATFIVERFMLGAVTKEVGEDITKLTVKQALKQSLMDVAEGEIGPAVTTVEEKAASKQIVKTFTSVVATLNAAEALLFIFDMINMGLDLGDVAGYSNVTYKEGYYKIQKTFKDKYVDLLKKGGVNMVSAMEYAELVKTGDSLNDVVIGPLDDLPILVLTTRISDKVTTQIKPITDSLTDKYFKYCNDNKIYDTAKITDYVTTQLSIDLDINAATEQAKLSLCTDLGGINVSMTVEGTAGATVQTFCSYSQDTCKANKAYSWPMLIDSTSPTLTTTIDEINAPLQIGTPVQIPAESGVITGVVTSVFHIDETTGDMAGMVQVQGSDGGLYQANKATVQKIYSDMYVEWQSKTKADGTVVGFCSLEAPYMRALCYNNGLRYDEDKHICIVDEIYCKSKALDWKYNDNIKDYDCFIGAGQEVLQGLFGITLTSLLKQTFDLSQYEQCKGDEVDGGYICQGCPSGYIQDNILNEILKKVSEITGTAFAAAGFAPVLPLTAGLGIAAALTSGTNAFLNSFCYAECPVGSSSLGPVCWTQCPPGFTDFGIGCAKPEACGMGVGVGGGIGTIPPCVAPKTEIAGLCYDPCADGTERDGLFCYPKCKPGYHKVGCCICSPDCPPGLLDTGISCTKVGTTRNTVFQLARTKNRIVPYSTKTVTPITTVVEQTPPPVQPTDTKCPDGKTYNPWTKDCVNSCPDGYERFHGLCYPNCNIEAAKKGLPGTYSPSVSFPQLCIQDIPPNTVIVADDGLTFRTCPAGTEYLESACYDKCPDGFYRNEDSPWLCWNKSCD